MGMGIGYKIGNGNGKECAIGRNGNVKSHSRSSLLATDVPCWSQLAWFEQGLQSQSSTSELRCCPV